MEIEPLLAHREDDSFKLEFMELQEHHKPSRTHYQGVELLDMGQSLTRNNKIQTFGEQDWNLSNSVIKCKFSFLQLVCGSKYLILIKDNRKI